MSQKPGWIDPPFQGHDVLYRDPREWHPIVLPCEYTEDGKKYYWVALAWGHGNGPLVQLAGPFTSEEDFRSAMRHYWGLYYNAEVEKMVEDFKGKLLAALGMDYTPQYHYYKPIHQSEPAPASSAYTVSSEKVSPEVLRKYSSGS